MRRLLIGVAALVVVVALFFVFRPSDEGGSTSATTTTTTSSTPTTTPEPPPPPPAARVAIMVKGGTPVGGVRSVTVAKGRRVVLVVTSDIPEEVHLHGYNIARDVAPGEPARITFRATIVGTVEAELEHSGVPLARITTKP
jgi:hypothetical protein